MLAATSEIQTKPKYVGPDRRVNYSAAGSTVGFAAIAAALLIAIMSISWLLARGYFATQLEPRSWTVVLSVAAATITVCSGVISISRFVLSRDRIALDVGMLMLVLAAGWLVPRSLVPAVGYDWSGYGRAISLGAAGAIAVLTVAVVFRPAFDQGLSVPRRLAAAVLALTAPPIVMLITGVGFDDVLLLFVAVPLIAVSAAVALTGGILRHRWLVTFVGMQFLGIQSAELFRIESQNGGEELWMFGASMVSFAAASLGLYGVVVDLRQSFAGDQAKLSRSWTELQNARKIARKEREAHQDRMHSLRSGLLGVEAVAWTISGKVAPIDVGEILAIEVRRLRELTDNSNLEISEFNLTEALDSLVVSQLRQGRALTLDAPRSLWIRAARSETVDAVHCLVDNSIRHAAGTPVTVSATISEDANHVEIRVRDRGPGVPEKMREKIFKRGVTTHEHGTGIGLSVARMIAEAQDGGLSFEPRLGGGSEFVMRLPIEPAATPRIFV